MHGESTRLPQCAVPESDRQQKTVKTRHVVPPRRLHTRARVASHPGSAGSVTGTRPAVARGWTREDRGAVRVRDARSGTNRGRSTVGTAPSRSRDRSRWRFARRRTATPPAVGARARVEARRVQRRARHASRALSLAVTATATEANASSKRRRNGRTRRRRCETKKKPRSVARF